eukprot:COSAG02_NODE_2174_length_9589_cov_49.732561_8_plen_114_part_00
MLIPDPVVARFEQALRGSDGCIRQWRRCGAVSRERGCESSPDPSSGQTRVLVHPPELKEQGLHSIRGVGTRRSGTLSRQARHPKKDGAPNAERWQGATGRHSGERRGALARTG